jgi:hypothetical protein
MPDPIVVPLRSKRQRRAQMVQKLNHAVPALGLFVAGKQAIAEGTHGFGFYLGVFEIVSAAALIVLTLRELRGTLWPAAHPSGHGHEHHGVDWVDIAAAFVLVAEILEHWHVTHHISRPMVLTACITFALGVFHGRIQGFKGRRRVLRVDDEGIAIPGRPFRARKIAVPWAGVQSIDVGPRWAVLTPRAGRQRKLDLADLETEAAARAALLEARRRVLSAPVLTTAE